VLTLFARKNFVKKINMLRRSAVLRKAAAMSDQKVIGIRVKREEYARIAALAAVDDRKIGTYVKREFLRMLPALEKKLGITPPPPAKAKPSTSKRVYGPKIKRN
jgi:hydrogenase maturation factor HypE